MRKRRYSFDVYYEINMGVELRLIRISSMSPHIIEAINEMEALDLAKVRLPGFVLKLSGN